MIEAFTELLKFHIKGTCAIQKEMMINLTEFCLAILRTNSKAISNPYIKAKALELIAIFIQADYKKELSKDFANSDIVKHTLMETLIQFYVDIEFAGSSSMFYTKF